MKAVFLGVGETLVAEELVAHVGDRVDNDQWGYVQDASAADVRVDSPADLPEALGL